MNSWSRGCSRESRQSWGVSSTARGAAPAAAPPAAPAGFASRKVSPIQVGSSSLAPAPATPAASTLPPDTSVTAAAASSRRSHLPRPPPMPLATAGCQTRSDRSAGWRRRDGAGRGGRRAGARPAASGSPPPGPPPLPLLNQEAGNSAGGNSAGNSAGGRQLCRQLCRRQATLPATLPATLQVLQEATLQEATLQPGGKLADVEKRQAFDYAEKTPATVRLEKLASEKDTVLARRIFSALPHRSGERGLADVL